MLKLDIILLSLLAGAATTPFARAEAVQPVVNGDFESRDAAPWNWLTSGGAQATGKLDSQEKSEGMKSYKIVNESPKAPNVFGALSQHIKGLLPDTEYRITCRLKGKNVTDGRFICGPGWVIRQPLPSGTYDWTPFSFTFTTDPSGDPFQILFIANDLIGALWIDDVKIEPASGQSTMSLNKPRETTPAVWPDTLPASAAFYPAYAMNAQSVGTDAPTVRITADTVDASGNPATFGADIRLARDSQRFFFN